eukprot:TRINITY_DN5117_c0_g1_i1.p1 TRINITY_DN5117_c0_g1~~TRINITY_DN5117_c0_g1_i1.p1  ORF type:complete len:104 (-),score=3.62 TRINITY_DN5117_c0_g1_i1:1263-1574(-)
MVWRVVVVNIWPSGSTLSSKAQEDCNDCIVGEGCLQRNIKRNGKHFQGVGEEAEKSICVISDLSKTTFPIRVPPTFHPSALVSIWVPRVQNLGCHSAEDENPR